VALAAPDLMVVDLMLGTMDGYEVIRQVRRTRDLPIIVVSAKADTSDIVAALEAGADDYVTKPFEVKEITARLRALRRRAAGPVGEPSAPDEVILDRDPEAPLVLRESRGTVHRGAQQLPLTLTEFRLLCELAAAPGRVFSRQALLERVWEHGFFGDERLVDVHVRRLRTKVERDPSAPRVVVTVRGLGYRLDPQ
jgi:DNA-binding response OmpR family regulator